MATRTEISVAALAAAIGGTVKGDPAAIIRSCATLESAGPDQVSFLTNQKYAKDINTTKAGAVIISENVAAAVQREADAPPLTMITAKDPYFAWQKAIVLLHGHRTHDAVGISPLAAINPSAEIGENASIHPYVTIAEGVTIGPNAIIYPQVTILANTKIGANVILYPGVTIYDDCVLGDRVIIHAGTVIGSDGYGYATAQGAHHKIPQTGNVIIGDDVEIGSNTVIERAVLESTTIGKGTKLGNSVIIGHNCVIGPHNLLVSQVGIAGSTTTGKYVVMAGQVGVAGHLNIADMTRIAAQSGVMQDITTVNVDHGGSPAMEAKYARRVYLQFVQLPDLAKRLNAVEKQLAKLQPKSEINDP